ncbi:MBL fold metallo-hydrolase [Derxia lacustris]|uniref:MBL fold metallo-hydrolase n=1 Tax=Derxia lacustris TaxID=764842 RepID=UPI001592D984|nr:MBL fold metallo-hydrolase [Derxia lacustris]
MKRLGVCALAALLAGCAGVGVGIGGGQWGVSTGTRLCPADGRFGFGATEPCPFDTPEPRLTELRAEALADGVWVLRGSGDEAAPRNRGWVANIGVIVGPEGVVLVDTGTSGHQIEAALAAVARLTSQPVVLAVVTHQAPEFVFGAAILRERGIPLLAHARAAAFIEERCEICLGKLRDTLGAAEMRDSVVTVPERTIDRDTVIAVGGREIELIDVSQARGTGDIVVRDRASGVLFASGLASAGRLPELRIGDLDGWQAALARLAALKPAIVVPGFGAPGGAEVLTDTGRYLAGLDAAVRDALARDVGLVHAMNGLRVAGFERWAGQSTIAPQNVQKRWLALEAAGQ